LSPPRLGGNDFSPFAPHEVRRKWRYRIHVGLGFS
jgi:hypothetical protein